MIAELLHKIAAEEFAVTDRPYQRRPSSAGPERCIRQMVYHARGEKRQPLGGRAITVFDDGAWHHELMRDWIRRTAYTLHSEEMEVTTKVGPGHIDNILTDLMGHDCLWEGKSISHFGYQRIQQGDIPFDYLTQVALYLDSTELRDAEITDAVITFKNKNQSAYTDVVVSFDPDADTVRVTSIIDSNGTQSQPDNLVIEHVVADAVAKFDVVDSFIKSGKLPERQYDIDHWRCEYCQYNKTCWSGWVDEHQQLAAEAELDQEVADTVRYYKELGAQKADITKEYDALRDKVKSMMKDRGIRSGSAGEYLIDWSVSMRKRLDRELLSAGAIQAATVEVPTERLNIRKRKERKQ